jgi:hypothetical protein
MFGSSGNGIGTDLTEKVTGPWWLRPFQGPRGK